MTASLLRKKFAPLGLAFLITMLLAPLALTDTNNIDGEREVVEMTEEAEEEAGHGGGITEKMMQLAIQLGLILFAAKFGGILFEKFELPGVLGEVISGLVIGPYLLGGISFYGFPHGLFPHGDGFPVSAELYGICTLASIILLFAVGLETDIRLLKRYTIAGATVGIAGVVFSFVLGDVVTMLFSEMVFGQKLGFFSPQCLFLGVISTATSVGITARILSERRKLDSPEGVTILAGAVIDDVLGIITLAVVMGVIAAQKHGGGKVDWGHIGMIAGKAVGIWLAATVIGLAASRRLSKMLKKFSDHSTMALLALGLALILAGFFEHAGLAMIVGAYVMGLTFSQTDINHVIKEKLDPIYNILVPIFFCVMGMLIDLSQLNSKPILIFGAVYVAMGFLSKIVGCGLPTLLFGFNMRGAMRVGVGMLSRGEIALIIAGIGMAAGIVDQKIVGVSVMMVIMTTLASPPLLVKVFSSSAPGTKKTPKEADDKEFSFDFPTVESAEMFVGKLLVIFENEGFFTHNADHQHDLYLMLKDEMQITFERDENRITFRCHSDDEALVNTAMLEVYADFEHMVKRLREPLDRREIAERAQRNTAGESKLKSTSFLNLDCIIPELKGSSKEEIIDELLTHLVTIGRLENVKEAREAVWEREKSMSTGMQYGVAIPHGRTNAVESLTCAVGLKKDGIDFDSLDGEPSKIFILTLSPLNAAAPHVQFMSNVSQALNDEGREALLHCRTSEQILGVLVR